MCSFLDKSFISLSAFPLLVIVPYNSEIKNQNIALELIYAYLIS